jgi:hypothetical protein
MNDFLNWITPQLKALPEGTEALCLYLIDDDEYDPEEEDSQPSFVAQLLHYSVCDPDDVDWAYESDYESPFPLCCLEAEDWEEALDTLISLMGGVIRRGLLPASVKYVATHYYDSDLETIYEA